MLSLTSLTVGPLRENCTLLADDETQTAVLIDPGDEAGQLLVVLKQHGLELSQIWLTHAHFDHVGAIADILDEHRVPVLMHPAGAPVLAQAAASAARWGLSVRQPPTDFQPLEPDQTLHFAGQEVCCLFTPGHAPGHIAFYFPEKHLIIGGDALFRGSIGRTDIPFGNHAQLLKSIKTKLLTLPADTTVYPGHGPQTTIGEEARSNPFLASV
jgi:glyoxylase-like metal-dependent hydrolase (beta-lactamase superfamily II)